jgi:hypothetical protein
MSEVIQGSGAMRKPELRERLFDLYATNLSLCFPHVKNTFLCPFCLTEFGKDAVSDDSKQVILAHCIPQALGGRLVTLACASCDCLAGHEIDVHLANRLETESFFQGTSPSSRRVWFKTHQQKVRADYRITTGSDGKPQHQFKLDEKNSRPGQWQAMKEAIKCGHAMKHFEVTQRGQMTFNLQISRIAMLRAGYLLMFRQYGYSYILNPNLSRLREQFKRPRDPIISGRPVVQIPRGMFGESTICFVISPKPLQAFLPVLVLRTQGGQESAAGVFMPDLVDDGDSVYERIKEHQEASNDLRCNVVNLDDMKESLRNPESIMLPYEISAGLRS